MGAMATMAQNEREVISESTRLALAELKKWGVILGIPANPTPEAIEIGREVRRQNAGDDQNNNRAVALPNSMRIPGQTWLAIANALSAYGFPTRRDKELQAVQGKRLVDLFN